MSADVTSAGRRLRNVVSNWGGSFYAVLVAYFLSPYLVRHLGDADYGLWSVVSSLTGYLGLLDFGVRQAVTRYVARHYANGDSPQISRVVSSALAIFAASGALAIVISATVAWTAVGRLHISPAQEATAQVVLLIAGCTVAVSLISGVFGGVLAGLQRFDLINVLEFVAMTVRALLAVLIIEQGGGLIGLAWVLLATAASVLVANLLLVRSLLPALALHVGRIDRPTLRAIAFFGLAAFVLQASNYLTTYTSTIVVAANLPIDQVTFFAIASSLIGYARLVSGGITTTLTPMASQAEASGGSAAVRRLVVDGARYASAVMLPVSVTLLLRGGTFVGLWMGPSYAMPVGRVLTVLTVIALITPAVSAAWAVMFGIGKHRGLIPACVAEAVTSLGLSIVLIRYFGLVGVAWGMAVPALVLAVVFWPWYVRRTTGASIREYVLSGWLRPFVAIVPFAAVSAVIERWWIPSGMIEFFLQVGCAVPVAALALWFVCVNRDDRVRVIGAIRRKLSATADPSIAIQL
jgi:O-antigen/teichoic acid export membrane protein